MCWRVRKGREERVRKWSCRERREGKEGKEKGEFAEVYSETERRSERKKCMKGREDKGGEF